MLIGTRAELQKNYRFICHSTCTGCGIEIEWWQGFKRGSRKMPMVVEFNNGVEILHCHIDECPAGRKKSDVRQQILEQAKVNSQKMISKLVGNSYRPLSPEHHVAVTEETGKELTIIVPEGFGIKLYRLSP